MAETPPMIPAAIEGVELCEVEEDSDEDVSVTTVDVAEVGLC